MSKNQIIIALVVLCLMGTIWGSVQDKKSENLERQLAAMKEQPAAAAAPAVDDPAVSQAQAQVKHLKTQNKSLLTKAATLKGTIASQKEELAALKQQVEESASSSQAVEALQAQLDTRTADLTALEENIVAVKAELEEKSTALVAAEEAQAGLEEVKNTLANNVDVYSAKSQQLSAEVEEYGLRVSSLEKALEERTKILQASAEELARTKLNMNVLLSKIGAQNNSLAILEETRIALAKELAAKFLTIEDLERQLSAQVTVEAAIVEDVVIVEESQVEEAAPAEEAPVEH